MPLSVVLAGGVLQLALAAVAAPVQVGSAPITQVTVYSDRAQVTRTASVALHGGDTTSLALPLLLDSIDTASVRVVATGGDVERVDITYVPASEFPREQAQKLLDQLTQLDADLDRLGKERQVWQSLLDTVRAVRPTIVHNEPLKPTPKLNPAGWPAGAQLVRGNAALAHKKLFAIDRELRALHKKRRPLAEEAMKIGGLRPRSGYRVTALVRGKGTAQLHLTYMVAGARWQPTYDIQLQPATGMVQLQFAGAVSQESGEDWTDAQLILSTAIPATATRFPKIPTWSIGERERFIPTPRPIEEGIPPAPPVRPALRPPNADEQLRQALARRSRSVGDSEATRGAKEESERDYGGVALDAAPPPPPPPPMSTPSSAARSDDFAMAPPAEAPAPEYKRDEPKPMVLAKPSPSAKRRMTVSKTTSASAPQGGVAADPEPTEALGLLPAGGWVRPSYPANLPASLAGGNDLTFPSIAKESVLSGKGARRVALLARTWPVSVERKLFPALAPEAYLVAELRSPEKSPLPGGQANLYVGADPAGTAALQLIVPGAPFTLPLGLDPALRPIRNVKVTTVEKGVVSKDEINEYTTTIELSNPHKTPVALRVLDQIPLTPNNKLLEVKLTKTEPAPAAQDPVKGSLEWRLTLPPGQKTTITFVYTLKRPKGTRLYQ